MSTPYEKFGRRVRAVLSARQKVIANILGGGSEKIARDYAIQGLYLVGVRSFETFLEDQILGLASKTITWKSRSINGVKKTCKPRLKEQRLAFVREIAFRGKDYADYLPYQKTIDISNQLFVGGRPFSLLTENERNSVNRCLRVRHYIAHESDSAARSFNKSIQSVQRFRMKKPTPSHYLSSFIRNGVTFFEHDIITLYAISRSLT